MCAAACDVKPLFHAVVNDGGQEGRGQELRVHLLHNSDAGSHFIAECIDLRGKCGLQLGIGFVGREIPEIGAERPSGQKIDAAAERQLQRFDKIEHGSVAPAEGVAVRGQLHTADDCVIACVVVADAVRRKRRNDGLVVEDLRHAAAETDDPTGCLQQLLRRIAEDAERKIGLRKQEQRLRPQEQITQLVRRVAAVILLAADGDIEADREAGKIARAARVAQIDDLVEFEPQTLCDLQCVAVRHAADAAEPVIRVQILIHPSRRK